MYKQPYVKLAITIKLDGREKTCAPRTFRVHNEGWKEVCGGEETRGCLGHRGQLCVATDCSWLWDDEVQYQ